MSGENPQKPHQADRAATTLPSTPLQTLNSIGSTKSYPKKASSPNFYPQSHQKQYVLLSAKQQQQQQQQGASDSVIGNSNLNKKIRPLLHKQPSSRYIFSVDDGEEEIEADINREYYEGYTDALRLRFNKRHGASSKLTPSLNPQDTNSQASGVSKSRAEDELSNNELESQIATNLEQVTSELRVLQEREDDLQHARNLNLNSQMDDGANSSSEASDDDTIDETRSLSSLESFTLRERQDAINETHPFGIKIWKPALYKKQRSVQRDAEADIHESSATDARVISLPIRISNIIWIFTFGLLIWTVCMVGTILCTLLSVTLFLSNTKYTDSAKYSKLLYNLGFYMLNPFGKIVILNKDDNYLEEDIGEGRSVSEYQRWRSEEEGRLFYAPRARPRLLSNNVQGSPSVSGAIQLEVEEVDNIKRRLFGRGNWNVGRVVFYLFYYTFLQPIIYIVAFICWLAVLTIPMLKLCTNLSSHIRRHPLGLSFKIEREYNASQQRRRNPNHNQSILLCTYRSFGLHYYKYTVDGTNIFFINMIFLVVFVIFDFYFFKEYLELDNVITNSSLIFFMCLASVIPLAYYIGQAVASISAQTSMGVGAVINAFFSTIVEVFLYCVALNQEKGRLVEGSMVGSILAAVLLLPGLSMCGGALKRKTQRYNPKSAGVSSTMLLFAIVVMFTPTLFYQIYGEYEIQCADCTENSLQYLDIESPSCQRCYFTQPALTVDRLYVNYLKPFSVICAVCLFSAYAIGLWFTLRTHAAMIWTTSTATEKPKQDPLNPNVARSPSLRSTSLADVSSIKPSNPNLRKTAQENQHQKETSEGGHDAPNWSRTKSSVILLGATLFYAIIAEILVDTVDVVLDQFPINPKFLGLTVFALVPNTTEFVNAISFAIHGNVALSMEIGSAYALQVCLLQVPALVIYSIYDTAKSHSDNINSMFTLIFPQWDIIASVTSVFLFTYIYAEGKSNYFKGSILILIYVVVITGFYFAGIIENRGIQQLRIL